MIHEPAHQDRFLVVSGAAGAPGGDDPGRWGGPGFPTTGSADSYLGTFGPLLAHRNLLLVNLRGTGNSSAFLCKALQNWRAAYGIAAYTVDTGKCGRQLNRMRRPGGGFVAASDRYTTAFAARDVALVLRRLRTRKVDFYGDSYGTFFGQTFTARYASLLRSVTLDSAYPVSQANPFYPHMIVTARHAFNLSCDRSAACHRAAPGRAWATIGNLARFLRAHKVAGWTRAPGGRRVFERVTVADLSEMVNDAGSDSGVYRELDPAARALLRDHDKAPLLRLTQQDVFTGTSGPVRDFNDGLYQAVTCLDYPQPFSYANSPAQRAASYARALAALPPDAFAPFTVNEWVTEPEEEFDACLDWPAPQGRVPPITIPPPYAPRNLPVLVLSGDLDSLTTPFEGQQVARDMGPSARWVLFRNDTHVNAMDDVFGCASGLVRRFIADPAGLRRLNTSCATHTPEVRVLGTFPARLSQVAAATARPGNQAGLTGRRLAAVGAAAAGDAVWRWYYGDGVHGWGLRGGTVPVQLPGRQPGRDPPAPGPLDGRHPGQRDRALGPGRRSDHRGAVRDRAARRPGPGEPALPGPRAAPDRGADRAGRRCPPGRGHAGPVAVAGPGRASGSCRGRAARQTMSRAVFHARRRLALSSGGPARPPDRDRQERPMRTSLRRGMIAAALAATLPGLAATGPVLASTARAGAAGQAATVLHATTGRQVAAGCSAGAHTLAPAGSHVYPETGNGGYISLHTDVHMVYDAVPNRFLTGNNVVLSDRATQCLTDFSLDFERRSAATAAALTSACSRSSVNGVPARFRFVQPTYPGDPQGPERSRPAGPPGLGGRPGRRAQHNLLPPACTPELHSTAGPPPTRRTARRARRTSW